MFSLQENPVSEERDFNPCLINAAQYVMALNFIDELEIVDVDLAENTGLKIIRSSKKALTPQIYDHLALINIAGICCLTIEALGADLVSDEMHKFPEDASPMLLKGNEGAYLSFKKNLLPVSRAFLLKPIQVEWSTILKAFEFFLVEEVYQSVRFVCSVLQLHRKNRISHQEIFEQLILQDFYGDLNSALSRFTEERYPLTKTTFDIRT